MNEAAVPQIFSSTRRAMRWQRMLRLQRRADAPRFLADAMAEEVEERVAFMRLEPSNALVLGDITGALGPMLEARGSRVTQGSPLDTDEEAPLPGGPYDLIASLGLLDTVNDLPGALVHMRHALAEGGIAIATIHGAGGLAPLRAAMLAADGERPAPRLHPMVDARGGSALMERAGFARFVVDTPPPLTARYGSLDRLVADLRAQGLSNVLRRPGPAFGTAALERARTAFLDHADEDGKVPVEFPLVALTGWG